MNERCDVVAPATEYMPIATQCEWLKGHSDSSRRIWEDVQFKMNFIEPKS